MNQQWLSSDSPHSLQALLHQDDAADQGHG